MYYFKSDSHIFLNVSSRSIDTIDQNEAIILFFAISLIKVWWTKPKCRYFVRKKLLNKTPFSISSCVHVRSEGCFSDSFSAAESDLDSTNLA